MSAPARPGDPFRPGCPEAEATSRSAMSSGSNGLRMTPKVGSRAVRKKSTRTETLRAL